MIFRVVALGAAVAFVCSVPAEATVLVSGSGWQSDVIPAPGVPSTNSPWTFSVSVPSTLAITDAFIPGDIYTLAGDVAGTTRFYAGSPAVVQATGSHGAYWTNDTYSKIAISIAPGAYSFTILGNGAGGTPSGLGVRLDAASPVPEASTWVMMTSAFGALGMTMRRRRRNVLASC